MGRRVAAGGYNAACDQRDRRDAFGRYTVRPYAVSSRYLAILGEWTRGSTVKGTSHPWRVRVGLGWGHPGVYLCPSLAAVQEGQACQRIAVCSEARTTNNLLAFQTFLHCSTCLPLVS